MKWKTAYILLHWWSRVGFIHWKFIYNQLLRQIQLRNISWCFILQRNRKVLPDLSRGKYDLLRLFEHAPFRDGDIDVIAISVALGVEVFKAENFVFGVGYSFVKNSHVVSEGIRSVGDFLCAGFDLEIGHFQAENIGWNYSVLFQ